MAARKAGSSLDVEQVKAIFDELSKLPSYTPPYRIPDPPSVPLMQDPKTGHVISRFRYSDATSCIPEEG
jgi:hypothetical protein